MITSEHVAQIRARLAQGASPEIVKQTILNAGGVTEGEVDQVLNILAEESQVKLARPLTPTSPPVPTQPSAPVIAPPPAQSFLPPLTKTPQPASTPSYVPPPMPKGRRGVKLFLISISVLVLIALGAGGVYAFMLGIGPFSKGAYTEANIISGILSKTASVHSLSYGFNLSGSVDQRDKDAVPFTYQIENQAALDAAYHNDYLRAEAISRILNLIPDVHFDSKGGYTTTYPTSLYQSLAPYNKSFQSSPDFQISAEDPVTKKPFNYIASSDKKHFTLQVTFDTPEAIKTIKHSYNYAATSTLIQGNTVTFTENSSRYFYLAERAPDPFIVELRDAASYAPSEGKITMSIGAKTDFDKNDWSFNIGGTGDLGDVTYKLDIDALRKDDEYFLKINNFPALPFLGDLSDLKGQWINLSKGTTTSSYNYLASTASEIPEIEKDYKKNREKLSSFMRQVASIADEVKLIEFRAPPHKETIEDGRKTYRYDLRLRKSAILPFYEKIVALAESNPDLLPEGNDIDKGTLDYLKSEEFSETYDYLDKNITLTLWVDSNGMPAKIENDFRVVPPDTATKLLSKQINIKSVLTLSHLNDTIKIDKPDGAKTIKEIYEVESALQDVKDQLSNMSQVAKNYYSHDSSYVGMCKAVSNVKIYIQNHPQTPEDVVPPITPVCNSSKNAYAIAASIGKDSYWCEDSIGYTGNISLPLGKKTSCR